MAHTISKQIYCESEKKYIECEVLVLDEEENLPSTDRREIILSCKSCGAPYNNITDSFSTTISDSYPETELIEEFEDDFVDYLEIMREE